MTGTTVKPAPGEIDKMKKNTESISPKKPAKGGKNYIPNGVGRGGKRNGSGRKPSKEKLALKGVQDFFDKHAEEIIETGYDDPKTGKRITVKKPRRVVAIEMLFQIGVKEKNYAALDKWLDRVYGRPGQTIKHEGEVDPEQQNIPTKAERAAAAAYLRELAKEDNADED
jgi:hypothetical protein